MKEALPAPKTEDPGQGPSTAFETRLLEFLAANNAIDADQVDRALRAQERTGGGLVGILSRLGLCEERLLAKTISGLTGAALLELEQIPAEAVRLHALSVPFLRENHVLPISESDDDVCIAVIDPTDAYVARSLQLMFRKPLRLVVGTASQIEDAILRLYSAVLGSSASEVFEMASRDATDNDLMRLRESASEAPIVRFVDRLIGKAVEMGASDIHIEPLERQLRVRLRVDGVLAEDASAPLGWAPAIVSRIKILANLDIAEFRLPQDGAAKLSIRGKEVDLRIATSPVVHGEEVVLRILDQSAVRLDLGMLGFSEKHLVALHANLERPNGILLVTGPTGSGKSTTLYAALERLNSASRKIITVEDPVEYKIDGLNQIQVKPEIGLDFARSLRSILRHDPDIIMIGEIRDAETARIATQAALTGHVVLSTLHTNDAASAIARLFDMGIEDYLVTSTVSAVLAQRLVRVLCQECRALTTPSDAFLKVTAKQAGGPRNCYRAVGCTACRGTGYRGRTVIAELMELDNCLRRHILSREDAGRIRSAAIESGMQSLFQNGLEAVLAGITTYDEVLRVAQDVEGVS